MAEGTPSSTNGRTLKEKGADWLFQQGVSTVLLCAILAFGAYAFVYVMPEHIKQFNEGVKAEAIEHKETVKAAVVEHKEAVKAIVESHDKDRQFYGELLRQNRVLMGPLTNNSLPGN